MQWVLQDFEDTRKLAEALERLQIAYSMHKFVPFVGELQPEPDIPNSNAVVMFGSYTLWRYAEKKSLWPGVFKIRPFVRERAWQPFLLNGSDALFFTLNDIPDQLIDDGRNWFIRPVEDSKEVPGRVQSSSEIIQMAQKVIRLEMDKIPNGALRHDSELMLTTPVSIHTEWRLWVVEDEIVTYSLYKQGHRVIYRAEIDADALEFARSLVVANPNYASAYVLDICRTDEGLRMLETNCINAAGFYAADLQKLVFAIKQLGDMP